MPSEPFIAFRCTAEKRAQFIAAVKTLGLTRDQVLGPLVDAFLADPSIVDRIKAPLPVGKKEALTEEERAVIHFMRNAGKTPGPKGEIEVSVLRDFKRMILVLREMVGY